MENSVKRCILTWHIDNFSLCDRNPDYEILSPQFSLITFPVSQWIIKLLLSGETNETCSLFLNLNRKGNSRINTAICVAFKFCCFNSKNEIWFETEFHDVLCQLNSWKSHDILTLDELLDQLHKDSSIADTQTVVCEMYFYYQNAGIEIFNSGQPNDDFMKLSKEIGNFCNRETFCDVSIVAKGKSIGAHKALLYARSPTFAKLLEKGGSVIELPSIKFELLRKILSFINSGDVGNLFFDDVPPIGIYECAKELNIFDLKWFYAPEEVSAKTVIHSIQCEFKWLVPNFTALNKNDCIFSQIFKAFPTSLTQWKLKMQASADGKDEIGIFAEMLCVYEPTQVIMKLSLLDVNEQLCCTRQITSSISFNNAFGFESFVKRDYLNSAEPSLLPQNTLCIICDLKYSIHNQLDKKYTSILEKRSKISNLNFDVYRNFSEDVAKLYENGAYSDAELSVGEKTFKVHKVILSARSTYFAAAFNADMREKATSKISILNLEPCVADSVLWYIYSGRVKILSLQKAIGLYSAAEMYDLASLKEKCSNYLQNNMDDESACEILIIAHLHTDLELKMAAVNYICCNSDSILISLQWQELLSGHMDLAKEVLSSLKMSYVKKYIV